MSFRLFITVWYYTNEIIDVHMTPYNKLATLMYPYMVHRVYYSYIWPSNWGIDRQWKIAGMLDKMTNLK